MTVSEILPLKDVITTVLPVATLVFTLVSGNIVQKTMQGIKKVSETINKLPPTAKDVVVGLLSFGLVKLGQLLAVQIDPTTTLDGVTATTVGTLITAAFARLKHAAEQAAK